MSLGALQRDFCDWLLQEDPEIAARLGLVEGSGLCIYQNNYRAALMDCLFETFPRTLAWLGGDAFARAAACHVDAHPPTSWTLDAYPLPFPEFLSGLYPDDPEVADLAALEWALSECFVSRDAPVLGIDDLAVIDWDNAVVRLCPATRLVPCRTNAPAIWTALATGREVPGAEMAAAVALLWRQDQVCYLRALDADEMLLMPAMAEGIGFAEVCEKLVTRHGAGGGVALAGVLLARWAGDGVLAAAP